MRRGTIDLATVLAATAIVTFVPAYAGIYAMAAAGRRSAGYAASFAVGVVLWSFSDVLGDSSYLGVNSGFGGGPNHASLIALFVLGLFVLVALDWSSPWRGMGVSLPSIVPLVIALGWGFHSLGEGVDIGSAALASGGSVVDLVGGYLPGLSYALHKLLEGTTLGAAYVAYSVGRGRNGAAIPLLGLLLCAPTLIGDLVGYMGGVASTYFFALGSGASVYILLRLAGPVFSAGDGSARYFARCMVFVALGFLALYGAALLHSA